MAFSELDASDPAFAPLTENAPTLDPGAAFAAIEAALGARLADRFRELDPNGISASIGQVHRGVLRDGRTVAVKVQYPGIADSLRWDLRALGWITQPVGGLGRGMDIAAYRDEIGRSLEAELDYARESKSLCDYARWTREWTGLVVPEVVPECTRGPVLTMTWVTGEPLARVRDAAFAHREHFAHTLLRLFLHGLFRWRRLHADPHPGNVRFETGPSGPRVGLLDFGCVHEVGAEWAGGWASVVEAFAGGTPSGRDLFPGLRAMGFDVDRLEPLADRVGEVMRVLVEPFLATGPWDPGRWRLGDRLAAILGEHRMTFRTAGPPSLVFVLRAFQGVLQYLKALGVPVRWRDLWLEVRPGLERRDPGTARISADQSGGGHPGASTPVGPRAARHLCLRAQEAGRTVVDLRLPAAALDTVADVMPSEVIRRLAARGISVGDMARRALAAGCPPGELFADRYGAREVVVWLE